MSKRFWYRAIAFLLCFIYVCTTPLAAYAENGDEDIQLVVEPATEYLAPFEEAAEALNTVVEEHEVYALVYLAEVYEMKKEPDLNSETLASIASGQEVQIIGVSEDEGQNIWYQVSYTYDEGVLEGYVERKYLATANEHLLEWEAQYVQSRAVSLWSMRRTVSYPDIEQFPESYQDALYELKSQHPNWTFVKMNTGIDFQYAINVQCEGSRSLIYAKSAKESWKNGMYDSTWAYCTPGIVKYYFDPRNALTDTAVFQFEHLGFNASYNTETATQKAVEGTFMDGVIPGTDKTYAKVLTQIGSEQNISPILLATRIRQEQGANGNSPLISGNYTGYEGLYNYYNIGATGQTTQAVIESGLKKAKELGWTDRIKALSGGASFLLTNYLKHGQDTLYLQKFDVDSRYDGVLWHQYMQNIQAPTTEAKTTYNTYKRIGILEDTPFVFRIPVYNNMPEYPCIQPGSEDKISVSSAKIENLPVNNTAVITTYINGVQNTNVEMKYTSSDTAVATVDANGVVKGISPGVATITIQKKENPTSANTVTCTVNVIKADISLTDITPPALSEVVYSPNTTLKNIPLPQGYAWVDSSIIPTVGNAGYSVTYNPDNSKYNTLVLTLPLTVRKATVKETDLQKPANLSAVAGTQLKSVSLPIGYTWDAPDTALPKKTGTYTYTGSYCTDVANYEILKGISLSVTVVCKNHEFGDWTGEHANCTTNGKLVRSCVICDEKEIVEEKAFGHNYESTVTKQPTTSQAGIRTFTCTVCKDTYTEEIPQLKEEHKHSYSEKVTKEATCTENGEKTFTCVCKDSYTETIEAPGHDIVNGGCSRCEYVEPSLPTHTHSYTESTRTATCTKKGEIIYTCSCKDTYSEEIEALGHDMKNGECTRCDYTTNPPKEDPKEETKPSTSVETPKPSASAEPSKEEKPSTSVETPKPSASVEPSKEEKPSTSVETPKPTASVEPSKEETKPSKEEKPSTSVETPKPSASVESSKEEEEDEEPSGEVASSESEEEESSSATGTTSVAEKTSAADSSAETTSSSASTSSAASTTPVAGGTTPATGSTTSATASTKTSSQAQNEEKSSATESSVTENTTSKTSSEEVQTQEETGAVVPTVQINMQDSTVLNAEKLLRVSANDKVVRLNMSQDIIWDVDVSDMEDRENISVNMAVTMGSAEVPKEVILAVAPDANYQLFSLAHNGEFGFDAVLTVPVEAQYLGMTANLFYYNPDTGALEFIDSCQVSADNRASFKMNHASDYVIVFGSSSMENITVTSSVITTDPSGFDGKTIAAISIVMVLLVATAAVVIIMIRKKNLAEKYYYFDEEDDLMDDRIK